MRSFGGRMSLLVVLGVLSSGVVAAGIAFACSPQANMALDQTSGAAGAQVVVSGSAFETDGPVEVRWGSARGPILATATGPSFSTAVTIPQASPGVYAIIAVGYDSSNVRAGTAPATYELTGPPAAAADPAPAEQAPAATADPAPAAAPVAQAPAGSTPTRTAASKPKSSPAKKAPASRPAASKPVVKAPARSQQTAASKPSSVNPPVVQTRSGRAVFGGSVAPVVEERAVARADRKPAAKKAAVTPAKAPQQAAVKPVAKSPALLPSASDPQVQTSSPGSTLMIGIGLLGIGLVAMFAGALVAQTRRRRAPVAEQRTRKH